MDIYKYINSRSVAAHCRNINKVWTPFDMATIIQRSYRSIHEKHLAFYTLMKEYPDMAIKEYESFHKNLLESIDYQEQTIALFRRVESGVIYSYKLWWTGANEYRYSDSVYTSYDKALKDMKEDWDEDDISEIMITKIFPDNAGKIEAYIDYSGNIYRIYSYGDEATRKKWYSDPNLEESFNLFASRYIDIPVPFKRGYILIRLHSCIYEDEPSICVLDRLSSDDPKLLTLLLESGDDMDMSGWGYFADETGVLYGDHLFHYDTWEYYNGKLERKDRILKYVSLFINGKIDLADLLIMQSRIVTRQQLGV